MKNISARAVVASAFLLAAGSTALAQDVTFCADHAEAAAAEWSGGSIEPLSDANTAGPGNYVVIAYGKKYERPHSRGDGVKIIRYYDGDMISLRNKVYDDEYDRCMGYHEHRIRFIVSGQ